MRGVRAAAFLTAIAGAALPVVVRAEGTPEEKAVATALFKEARELMDRGEIAAACDKFAESQRLEPAGGTLLNLAVCNEKRGRLGILPLNQVKQQIRESEFTQLLDGFSLAEYLFFEAEVGKTLGPLQGPDGWFIARVNTRTPARRKIDVKSERERELVREDFLTTRFLEWAAGVMARTKVD